METKIRSTYAILPESVYQAVSTVPEHVDPLSGETIPARAIYRGGNGAAIKFATKFPNARQSNDHTKRLIKDPAWTRRDLFGIEQLIAMAGFAAEDENGIQQYGIFQHNDLIANVLSSANWASQ